MQWEKKERTKRIAENSKEYTKHTVFSFNYVHIFIFILVYLCNRDSHTRTHTHMCTGTVHANVQHRSFAFTSSHSSLFHERVCTVHSHTYAYSSPFLIRLFLPLIHKTLSVCILACESFGSHIICQCIGLSVWLCVCMHSSSWLFPSCCCCCYSLLSVTQIRIVFKNQTNTNNCAVYVAQSTEKFQAPFFRSCMFVWVSECMSGTGMNVSVYWWHVCSKDAVKSNPLFCVSHTNTHSHTFFVFVYSS